MPLGSSIIVTKAVKINETHKDEVGELDYNIE